MSGVLSSVNASLLYLYKAVGILTSKFEIQETSIAFLSRFPVAFQNREFQATLQINNPINIFFLKMAGLIMKLIESDSSFMAPGYRMGSYFMTFEFGIISIVIQINGFILFRLKVKFLKRVQFILEEEELPSITMNFTWQGDELCELAV